MRAFSKISLTCYSFGGASLPLPLDGFVNLLIKPKRPGRRNQTAPIRVLASLEQRIEFLFLLAIKVRHQHWVVVFNNLHQFIV